MVLFDWLMLTSYAMVVGFCGSVSESRVVRKENDFQWTTGVVVTSTSGAQPT